MAQQVAPPRQQGANIIRAAAASISRHKSLIIRPPPLAAPLILTLAWTSWLAPFLDSTRQTAGSLSKRPHYCVDTEL